MSAKKSKVIARVQQYCLGLSLVCLLLPLNSINANPTPITSTQTATVDDRDKIVDRIKDSLSQNGLISLEQYTGRLLFNPVVEKLHAMPSKQKFILPAIIVNQDNGLKLIGELPFACFTITAGELATDNYKGYRQNMTLHYIRDVKNFAASRALICSTVGSATKQLQKHLSLNIDSEPYIFEEHVSISGERFYYFLNLDGSFEMYM